MRVILEYEVPAEARRALHLVASAVFGGGVFSFPGIVQTRKGRGRDAEG
jgi:hypothetical protein